MPAADTKPTRLLSQFTTHVLSIVRQPSPLTVSSIGVPTGPDAGVISKLCVTSMPFCATGSAVDERDDIVDAAVVFGDGEARVETAVRVDRESPERGRGLGVFLPAEVIVVLDDPAAGDGLPRELDGLSCGKIRCGRVHLGTDGRRTRE